MFLDLEYPAYLFGIKSSALREKLIRFVFVFMSSSFLPSDTLYACSIGIILVNLGMFLTEITGH